MNNFINFLKQKLNEDAPTNAVGDGNGPVKLMAPPIGAVQKRVWGGKKEITIPHAQYESIKNGRARGQRWDESMPAGPHRDAVQSALYKDGAAIVTSDFTNASVILKHYKQQRWKQNDEVTLS